MKFSHIFILLLLTIIKCSCQPNRSGEKELVFDAIDLSRQSKAARPIVRTYTEKFYPAFETTPKVAVALSGFQASYIRPGISVDLVEATPTSFTYTVTTYPGASVKAVSVKWFATISPNINIGYYKEENPVAADIGNGTWMIAGEVPFKSGIGGEQLRAVAFISGFQFIKYTGVKLSPEVKGVHEENVGLEIYVSKSNIPKMVNIVVIQYKETAGSVLHHETAYNGALYSGIGCRHTTQSTTLPNDDYVDYYALSAFEFAAKRDYIMFYSVTLIDNERDTSVISEFFTHGNSKVHQARGSIFYI